MARTLDDIVREALGNAAFEQCKLVAALDAAKAEIEKLKAHPAPLNPSPSPPSPES